MNFKFNFTTLLLGILLIITIVGYSLLDSSSSDESSMNAIDDAELVDLFQGLKTDPAYNIKMNGDVAQLTNQHNDLLVTIEPKSLNVSNKFQKEKGLDIEVLNFSQNEVEHAIGEEYTIVQNGSELNFNFDEELTLQYQNSRQGLRQNFIIHDGPKDKADISIDLKMSTNFFPLQLGKKNLVFMNGMNDSEYISYRDLKVFDANNKVLDSEMSFEESEVAGDYIVSIHTWGEDVSYPLTIDPLIDANWMVSGGADSLKLGYVVENGGDINGDGFDDVIVGVPFEPDTSSSVGRIEVYFGSATGLSTTPSFTRMGVQTGAQYGYAIAGGGDINNDGFDDFAVGAYLNDWVYNNDPSSSDKNQGAVFVHYGSAAGVSAAYDSIVQDIALGSTDTARFGSSVALLKFNNDDFHDVAVGSYSFSSTTLSNRGSVIVFPGGAGGVSSLSTWSRFGQVANGFFGWDVENAGDINGDGGDDLLIGAYGFTAGVDTAQGKAFIYYGLNSGTPAQWPFGGPQWEAVGPHKGAQFGQSVAGVGDINGDGFDDIAVGADRYSTMISDSLNIANIGNGGLFIYHGTATGLSLNPDFTFEGPRAGSGFGTSVSGAGDVNGDGFDDVVVGAPSTSTNTLFGIGEAYAFYGTAGGLDMIDWTQTGETMGARFGFSVSGIGDVNGDGIDDVGVGAEGFSGAFGGEGAAYAFYGNDPCGLTKYGPKPVFLTFPDDISITNDSAMCGAIVEFDLPTFDDNCPGATLAITAGTGPGTFFPVGVNTVSYTVTNAAGTQDSTQSFTITVMDVDDPRPPASCGETVLIDAGNSATSAVVNYTPPVFTDYCSVTVTLVSGPAPGDTENLGAYDAIYRGVDPSGNESFCTVSIIILDTSSPDMSCNPIFILDSIKTVIPIDETNAYYESVDQIGDQLFTGSAIGPAIFFKIVEGAIGIDIPDWVEKLLGVGGFGINLAFVGINFGITPGLDMTYGTYNEIIGADSATMKIDYPVKLCIGHPEATYFGCKDTITLTTSTEVLPGAKLEVDPGVLRQEMGVIGRDLVVRFAFSMNAYACIGIPNPLPVGPDCIGYKAEYNETWDLFDPITIWDGGKFAILTTCDKLFVPEANWLSIIECGADVNIPTVANQIVNALTTTTGIDGLTYDADNDLVTIGLPSLLTGLFPVPIPEFDFTFGRLDSRDLGVTSIIGNKLTVTGTEDQFGKFRLDILSFLDYVIYGLTAGSSDLPPCVGIGTTLDFGCGAITLDIGDLNVSLRNSLTGTFSYDPVITLDSLKLPLPMNYLVVETGDSGFSNVILGVEAGEMLKLEIPDGVNYPLNFDNLYKVEGNLEVETVKQINVDFGIKFFTFGGNLFGGDLFSILCLDPLVTIPGDTKTIQDTDIPIIVPNAPGSFVLIPDSIPPVVFCKDTTVFLNQDGFAFLDAETAFDAINSYDLPIGGTGVLRVLDVFPDTIFCSDWPQTTGYLVVDDDNCNIDTCEFTVFVEDIILPQMGCVDITVGIGELGTYIVNPDEVAIGITDNCRDLEVTVDPDTLFCEDVGTTIDITVMVTDIAGNTNSCVASVTIIDTMALLLECPYLLAYPVTRYTETGFCAYISDLEEFRPTLLAPDCNTVITYELTGATTLSGMSNAGGVAFNLGETTVTYTATDESGNSTSCSFIVIVEDNVLPLMTCPASVDISTNEDGANDYNCTTDYTWDHPTPTDNCNIIAYEVVYTNPDGSTETEDLKALYDAGTLTVTRNFGLGITEIKYTALDTMSNMVMCTFSVNVIDDEAPMIFCENVTAIDVFTLTNNVNIEPNDVTTATINVPVSMSIAQIGIIELVGTQPDMGDLSMTLTSPQGTTINLFGGLCAGTSDFDAPLYDSGAGSITTGSCGPLAGGVQLMPVDPLATFNGEDSQGDWILTMTNTGMGECGVLTDWALEIIGSDNAGGENVIQLVTDPDACSFTISDTRFDPEFVDNCEGATSAHNGTAGPFTNTLNGYVLPIGETIIEWIVTDPSGNADTCELIFIVIDDQAPTFLNCPKPDVIENAEFGECQAFANFSLPIAEDNCGAVDVVQIDNTGLAPGSIFPVGTTILEYEATDEAGNTALCSVRVIINDTQAGSFACPDDIVASNDEGLCSAVVTGISPKDIEDNCLANNSVLYQIEYPAGSGSIVGSGVEDASGEVFDQGASTVTYSLYNQPILLITEVAQEIGAAEGGMDPVPYSVLTTDDYLEITNIGPAAYNVSGLEVERFGAGYRDTLVIPNTTIIQPGQTLVVHFGNGADNPGALFFNIPCAVDILSGDPAGYAISYKGRALDVAATNGYDPIGQGTNAIITAADWSGSVASSNDRGGIIRTFTYDNNNAGDWFVAENCNPLTIGALNPDIEAYSSNGTTTALQSIPPDNQTCSFTVTVNDTEAPQCKEDDDRYSFDGPGMLAVAGMCNTSTISDPDVAGLDCKARSISVSVSGAIIGAEDISIYIISPQNDTVTLYDQLCTGDYNSNMSFFDESTFAASSLCGSNMIGDVRPQEGMLMTYYGTSMVTGDWTLFVDVAEGSTASFDMTSWTLSYICLVDWEMEDVVLENDLSVCNAEFTWIHPFFHDNCGAGTISVNYSSDDPELIVPVGGPLNNNFGKGGYEVTATFPVGITTVTYTLTDPDNNQSTCSFTVTVNDTELPVITFCPNDIYVGLESGECEEVVFYNVEAMDNCGILSIIGVPESGSYFPIGITPVVVTVTDIHGNVSLCEFNVIVGEFEPGTNQLACNNAINLSLDQNCEAVILTDQILEGGDYGCFDDYCITIETETGIPHPNYFDLSDVDQTFVVTVIDCNGDSTNSCWGTVTIQEKFSPKIQCPNDITIACNQDPDLRDEFGVLLTGEAFLLNCEPGAEIIYEDNAIDYGQCATPRMEINRTWIVTDADGNQDACTQLITIDEINLDDIVFPEDLDLEKSLECFDVNLDPSLIHPDSTGRPAINGLLVSNSGSLCMISMNMSDEIFDICPGSYEILRTWKIRNMCLPISDDNPIEHTQIIKVLDTTPPKMVDCPDDMTLSVDPWGCQASGLLPIPQNIYDQCSDVVFSAAVYGGGNLEINGTPQAGDLSVFTYNLRVGLHTIVYRTKDECNNTQVCEFDITVVDNTPPTAIALQNIVIGITSSGTGDDGVGKLYVESVDNGSFDGCGPVKLEIRRDTDLCDFSGNITYNADGHPQDGSPNPNSPNYDPDDGAYVKFCCDDLYNTDLDVNDDGVNDVGYVKVWLRVWDDGNRDGIFGNDGDQYNEAWAYVKVEDKLAPVITCPADITITCDADSEDLNVTGEAIAYGTCGAAPVEYNDIIINLNTCNEGFIRRRWNVIGRLDVFCDQTITMEGLDAPISVSFAQVGDTEVSGCPDQIVLGEPTWIAGPCDVMGYTVETDTFFFEDGACYKMVNTYSVINWCAYDPNSPFWEETEDFTDGIVRHVQIVKVIDDTSPTIATCVDQMFAINDHTDSDEDGNVCEASIVLTNSATDPGSANCPTGWLKWQVFVDLWGDGTDDLEFSSYLPPFDNSFNDTNSNGIPDKYVAPTANGDEISIALPDIEGSMSNHKVRWIVSDGCQNNASCEWEFMVVDKKAPTPYCLDISTAVMENDGTVTIWASDFNVGSFDNCTAEENLRYTFSDIDPDSDPLYDALIRSSSRTFDCDDVDNSPVAVNMYVWDEKGNVDFCLVYLTVIDNNGTCGDGSKIAGNISTEVGDEVVGADVRLQANLPEYPRVSPTTENGVYTFLGSPINADYQISSSMDIDYMNGVSTLDLVFIQRHILQLELLDSPYKVFAADVNGDEKTKVSDILVLRKLILGIIDDIPNNESWRFVDKNQEFSDILNPWPIEEALNISSLQADMLDNDFIAVKIGDVNNDAVANLKEGNIAVKRDLKSIDFMIEDRFVAKGEEVEVIFKAGDNFELSGYQFSIELDGLTFEEVGGQSISLGKENVGLISKDLITMSYHKPDFVNITEGSDLFSIKFIATETGRISDMIQLTSKLTRNEAYLGKNLELREVALRTENDLELDIANKLYQNEPNPFRKLTSIGFDLATSSKVTMTILNATGSVITSIYIDGKKGHNTYELDANLIGMSGLYYYKVKCDGFMDTKKMILVR